MEPPFIPRSQSPHNIQKRKLDDFVDLNFVFRSNPPPPCFFCKISSVETGSPENKCMFTQIGGDFLTLPRLLNPKTNRLFLLRKWNCSLPLLGTHVCPFSLTFFHLGSKVFLLSRALLPWIWMELMGRREVSPW
ncbi:uncharacterized protein [Malus domestica]|uniref:uncharacterized protein isoform X2 n=1 Tax=Malus domestica TaxID=3750 RepID=UPI0039760D51